MLPPLAQYCQWPSQIFYLFCAAFESLHEAHKQLLTDLFQAGV